MNKKNRSSFPVYRCNTKQSKQKRSQEQSFADTSPQQRIERASITDCGGSRSLSWRALPSSFCISDANTSSRICTELVMVSRLSITRKAKLHCSDINYCFFIISCNSDPVLFAFSEISCWQRWLFLI